jgi:ABC-type nitrate/sulfonate/bicarbonate transport system substrate-binding protein
MAADKLYTLSVIDLAGGGTSVAVRPDSPIKTPADLRGKRIAVQADTGSEVVMQSTVLPSIGLTSDDYELVNIPADRAVEIIDDGTVDAALVYDPNAAKGVQDGKIRILFDLSAYDVKPILLVGRRDYVDEHPEETAAFLECFFRAMREAQDNPVKTANIMREEVAEEFGFDLTADTVSAMLGRVIVQPSFTPDVMMTIDTDAATQLETGRIEALPDTDRLIRLDLQAEALEKAGWDGMRIAHGTVGAHTPLLTALAGDGFKLAGVDVVTRRFPTGAEGIQGVIDGRAEFGEAGAQPTLRVLASGRVALVGLVGYAAPFQWLQVAPDSSIKTVKDLVGKRVAVDVGTSLEQNFLFKFLPMEGLSADDITVVEMKTAKQIDALKAGEVDAILQVEFDAAKYVSEGSARNLASLKDADLQPVLIYANKEAIHRNKQQVIDVLRGVLWGQDMVRTNPEAVAEILEDFYTSIGRDYPKDGMLATLQTMTDEIDPMITETIVSYLQDQAEALHAAGRLSQIPDWDTAVRTDLMEEAMKERLPVAQ